MSKSKGWLPVPAGVLLLALGFTMSGCAAAGLAALGAAGAAGGYEAYQYSEMNQVENAYRSGDIDRQEYEARRNQIEDSSITQ